VSIRKRPFRPKGCVAQSPWKIGLAKTAKWAGPFQRTEVRQRDKGPLRSNPYFFLSIFFTAPYHSVEKAILGFFNHRLAKGTSANLRIF
jgi:hypothetical protein